MLAFQALDATREQEIIERVSQQLVAWNLREPAIVFLTMHSPLAFLGSQFLIAAQPFVSTFVGDAFARDLAHLLQDPKNVELLVSRLEKKTTT